MPPKVKKSKITPTESNKDGSTIETQLRILYTKIFLNPKNSDNEPVLPLLSTAMNQVGMQFEPEIRPRDQTIESYSMDDFCRDYYRLGLYARRREDIEQTFDILAENGLLSREDERGYETGERVPIDQLVLTVGSFHKGSKRLNQRIPKTLHLWMLHMIKDPYEQLLRPADIQEQLHDRYSFSQFKRMLFACGLMDDLIPTSLINVV